VTTSGNPPLGGRQLLEALLKAANPSAEIKLPT
jgi:hypothetical protein